MFRNEKKILFLDAGNFEKKSITLKKIREGRNKRSGSNNNLAEL